MLTTTFAQASSGVVLMCNETTMISFTGFEWTVDNDFPIKWGLFYHRHPRRLHWNNCRNRESVINTEFFNDSFRIETHGLYFSLQYQVGLRCIHFLKPNVCDIWALADGMIVWYSFTNCSDPLARCQHWEPWKYINCVLPIPALIQRCWCWK